MVGVYKSEGIEIMKKKDSIISRDPLLSAWFDR